MPRYRKWEVYLLTYGLKPNSPYTNTPNLRYTFFCSVIYFKNLKSLKVVCDNQIFHADLVPVILYLINNNILVKLHYFKPQPKGWVCVSKPETLPC